MRLTAKTILLLADLVSCILQLGADAMFRILAFTTVLLAASAASAQQWCPSGTVCPTCPAGVCPVPQSQFQQFSPPVQYQQPVQQPPVQRRVERFEYGRTYSHVSRREVRQEARQQRRGQPVHFNGTSSWSWPNDLRQHMLQHGLDPDAAAVADRQTLQAWHDRIHWSSGKGTPDQNDAQRYLR